MILSNLTKEDLIKRIKTSDIEEVTVQPVIIEREPWEVDQGYKHFQYAEDREIITLQIERR